MSFAGLSSRIVCAALACAGACAVIGVGCQSTQSNLTGPQNCTVKGPCPDDPTKTCDVPCKGDAAGAGKGQGAGGGGAAGADTGGSAGAGGAAGGGTGGAGLTPVDASGSVVEFASTAFVETAPYTQPVDIFAPAATGETIKVTSMQGAFSLTAAAQGPAWVFAQDSMGSPGVFATYSPVDIESGKQLLVPLVPADVLNGIATQLGVQALTPGHAHLVLRAIDKKGAPVPGVTTLPLAGATLGFDTGAGAYAPNTGATSNLGFIVQLNVRVGGPGYVEVTTTYQNSTDTTKVPISADAVTYGYLLVSMAP